MVGNLRAFPLTESRAVKECLARNTVLRDEQTAKEAQEVAAFDDLADGVEGLWAVGEAFANFGGVGEVAQGAVGPEVWC